MAPARLWRDSATPGKTSARAAPATASAGGKKLKQRRPALGCKARERVDAQRLRNRRRDLGDEGDLKHDERCEVHRTEHRDLLLPKHGASQAPYVGRACGRPQ